MRVGIFSRRSGTISQMLKKAVYLVVALLASFSTDSGGQFASRALAQSERSDAATHLPSSHRFLTLPADGTEDLLQQFRMLQHLQDLVAQKEDNSASRQLTDPKGIAPELLQQLRRSLPAEQQELLDMAQEHLSNMEGLDANTKSKLKSAVENFSSNPASAQSTAEELLRQFHQTRQLPFAPSSSNSSSAPKPAVTKPAVPSRAPTEGKGLPQEPSIVASELPPAAEPMSTLPGLAQGLRPINPSSPKQSTPNEQPIAPHNSSQTAEMNRASTRNLPSLNSGSSAQASESAGQGGLSLDQIISHALGKNGNPAQSDQLQIPTVPELLRQTKENPSSLPSLKIPENSLNLDEIKKFLAERFSNLNKDKDPWLDSLKKSLPTSFKAELHKAGLHQSLTKVMDDMKKGNQQTGKASPNSNRQFELDPLNQESMGATLSSIKKDLEQFSKQKNPTNQETGQAVKQPVATSKPTTADASKSQKSEAGFFKRASGMFNDWMPNSKKKDPQAADASAAENSQAARGGLQGLLAIGLGCGLLVGAVWYLSRWKPQPSVVNFDGAASLAIATRADIVQAFHFLVNASGMSVEEWWTHRRAASEISRLKPATERHLELLARLYEIARYSPAEYQLTDEQIQQARRALEQIATC